MSELLCFTLSSLNNSIIKKTLHHFLQVYGLSFAATYGSFKWVSLSASYVAINRKASGRRINKLNCCCLYKISTYSHLSIVAVRGSWMYGLSRSRSHEHHDYNWQLCRHLFISIFSRRTQTQTHTQAKCSEPAAKFGHSFLLFHSVQRNPTGFHPSDGAGYQIAVNSWSFLGAAGWFAREGWLSGRPEPEWIGEWEGRVIEAV